MENSHKIINENAIDLIHTNFINDFWISGLAYITSMNIIGIQIYANMVGIKKEDNQTVALDELVPEIQANG